MAKYVVSGMIIAEVEAATDADARQEVAKRLRGKELKYYIMDSRRGANGSKPQCPNGKYAANRNGNT